MKLLLIALSIFAFGLEGILADCSYGGKNLKTGEGFQPPGQCALYICNLNNLVTAKACPLVATLKPCKFVAMDTTKPYPDCCPRHEC